jgi:penicillin-binding protein 1A
MLVAEEDAPPPGPTGPLSDVPLIGQFQKLIQSLTGSGKVEYTYPERN